MSCPVAEGEINAHTEWDFADVECDAVLVGLKKQKFPAKQHARAVAKHLGVQEGLIYLPGLPSLNYEDSDQEVFFRQRRYFYYLSGLNYEDCIVTYNIKRDGLYVWIPPPRTGRSVIYNGENPSIDKVKRISDFDFVATTDHIHHYLSFFTNREKSPIYLLHDSQRPTISPSIHYQDGTQVMINPVFDHSALKPAMDAARVIKSPYEIAQIRKASAITTEAHVNVLRAIRDLKNESEIEAIFTGTCIALQAKNQAYGVIAGSGKNASTLHYGANNEPLKGRQLVCLDAGCEWKNYASDVTRTFPISGKWTKEAKEIHNLVAKMQNECIEMVKPGADYRNIQKHAHQVLVAGLLDLGLLQGGTFEEVFRSGVSVAFLPHGLGHYMGLEVHDMGPGGYLLSGFPNESHAVDQRMGIDNIVQNRRAYRRQPINPKQVFDEVINSPDTSNPSILKENVVITVEPGIYFSEFALEQIYLPDPAYAKYINKEVLAKYYDVGGVRIEDDLLVTKDGYENLTTTPKGDAALKIILNEPEDDAKEVKKTQGWFW